jgi:hypothetical protein
VLCLVAAAASAQQGDRIFVYDRVKKKEDRINARVKDESPKEIVIERATRTEKLPVGDVLDIDYQIPADLNLDIRAKAKSAEEAALKETDPAKRLKINESAIAGYRDLIDKLPKEERYDRARWQAEFRIAVILASEAEDDPSRQGDALKALTQFKTDHDKSWQIGRVGKLLARIQIAKGDIKSALVTYEEFARRDDLAAPLRQEYELLGIRALLSAENFADAERKLTTLAKSLAKDDPQAVRVETYLAACQANTNLPEAEKRLQRIIHGDAGPAVKALAYNTLGDCYRRNNRLEDAFWQYLWVDQEYNQDREEHAKALYYLAILFDKVKKSPARAQFCRDRLLTDKLFAGLEYQKLAAKESQKPSGDK